MTVIVKHNKTNTITDWTQAQLDEQIALGNFAPGTTLANIVLPSDWNNDHTLTGVGTMAEQDATAVAITGGTINNTTIGATTATTGKFTSVTTPSVTATTNDLTLSAISTGKINLNTATANQVQITDAAVSAGQYTLLSRDNSLNEQRVSAAASSGGVNLGLSSALVGAVKFYTNGFAQQQLQVSHTASAVNYVQVTGAATGGAPAISAQGSDTNSTLSIASKGTGAIRFDTGGATAQFRVLNTASAVNRLDVTGSATGFAVQSALSGTDTNISMAFQPKGTGAIDLAAGSSGVNISNGGTVTAITRSAAGSGYTTVPSVAISAPTTAGGVQATATAQVVINGVTSIANGGTGYTVGDVLTVSGGTAPSQTTQLTVATVSAGVITSVNITRFGTYTVTPTNPASVTGGTGSSATFNLNYAVQSGTFTITNAGSGYIEQPTITFSGGGGSGASAFAVVGALTTFRSLHTEMQFNTAGGVGFEVQTFGAGATTSRYATFASSSGNPAILECRGAAANISAAFSSKGTSALQFYTNSLSLGTGSEQLRVSHTASAVNYVQVTGGATGVTPIISVQGSDTNAILTLRSKGTFAVTMQSSAGANMFEALPTASSVNYLRVTPSIASSAPILSAQGTDTDIDLSLTPKGAGVVQFGTYTGTILTPTGYITIKDSGGTTRRLLVG